MMKGITNYYFTTYLHRISVHTWNNIYTVVVVVEHTCVFTLLTAAIIPTAAITIAGY